MGEFKEIMPDDCELIDKFKKADSQAFELIVRKYKDKVYNTAYSILGNPGETDDVAQEVFIEAFKSLKKFRGESSLLTWFYRVAVNKSLDELRKRKRNKFVSYESEINEEGSLKLKDILSSNEEGFIEKLQRQEIQKMVSAMIDSLPEKYRAVLVLKDLEGLSYREISQVMKISPVKVSVWLFRARERLKERLSFLREREELD